MEQNQFRQKDYERAARLLSDLFEAGSDVTVKLYAQMEQNGIDSFFDNLKPADFPDDVAEKLTAVRMVLHGMGEIPGSDETL